MSTRRNKRWTSLGIAASVVLLLSACGKGDTSKKGTSGAGTTGGNGEKVSLEFWSFWGDGARREVVEEIIDDFNKEHDNIEVKYVYQPWGDIWTKSLAAVAAGNPPDIVV